MLSIATSTLLGSLPEKLTAIAEAGFEAIDLSVADLVGFDGPPAEIAGTVDAAGLKIASFGPVAAPFSKAKLTQKVEMARTLKAPLLVVQLDGIDLAMLPDEADLGDVKIALRPCPGAVADVPALLSATEHPGLGLAIEARSVLGAGARPAQLRDWDLSRVLHVQMVDGPEQALLPGQGRLNLAGLARVLARAGYTGLWSVAADPQGPDTALTAFRALATLLSDAAETEPDLRPAAPRLPAKVLAKGIEFVEFAVDETSARELEDLLGSMAFRRERRHFSKNVTLWRQGAVNIVVNRDRQGHAHTAFRDHGPTVCDMGLRVGNAAETVARATALGTRDFTQDVGIGQLDIPAIRGVGGSLLHFIDENSDLHRVWDIEFAPVQRTRATPPAGIRRIDHIAQTMRYDQMQNWLTYYLSTFQMTQTPIVNVADPSGITLSQALESPEGAVRLNLNGAAGRDTRAGSFLASQTGAGIQHIAFQTDDIFETSGVLATNGFARLSIPRNYYVETQTEFDLSDEMVAKLQADDLLYDEDGAGRFFQLYAVSIFSGFFFEIVQRCGGYAGYGARNAPVRLAAQSRVQPQARQAS